MLLARRKVAVPAREAAGLRACDGTRMASRGALHDRLPRESRFRLVHRPQHRVDLPSRALAERRDGGRHPQHVVPVLRALQALDEPVGVAAGTAHARSKLRRPQRYVRRQVGHPQSSLNVTMIGGQARARRIVRGGLGAARSPSVPRVDRASPSPRRSDAPTGPRKSSAPPGPSEAGDDVVRDVEQVDRERHVGLHASGSGLSASAARHAQAPQMSRRRPNDTSREGSASGQPMH